MPESSRLESGPWNRRAEKEMSVEIQSRGDGKYAQVVEGGGDRVAAWRIRQREQRRSSDADVPATPCVLRKEFGSY